MCPLSYPFLSCSPPQHTALLCATLLAQLDTAAELVGRLLHRSGAPQGGPLLRAAAAANRATVVLARCAFMLLDWMRLAWRWCACASWVGALEERRALRCNRFLLPGFLTGSGHSLPSRSAQQPRASAKLVLRWSALSRRIVPHGALAAYVATHPALLKARVVYWVACLAAAYVCALDARRAASLFGDGVKLHAD